MTDRHICRNCGHLDGDHGDGYCTKASGACSCLAFQPPLRAPSPSTDQEPPMTDHAKAAARLLSLAGDDSDDRHAARQIEAANGYALLAVADAIRGLTPNAVQDAPGCPQNDPQPEPGQLDGDRAAEAAGGGWDRNRVAYREPPAEPLASYGLTSRWALGASEPVPLGGGEATGAGEFADCPRCDRHLRAVQHFKSRAEKAEAERDAILNELRDLRDATFTDTRHALSKIINRHTPEG